jgi:hypothetical protein
MRYRIKWVFLLKGYFCNDLGQVVFARYARKKEGKVVQISGKARNLNHLSSLFASVASKKALKQV